MTSFPSAASVVATAVSTLKDRVEEVNRLNVFPVPDGDTGSNMFLTLESVLRDVANLGPNATIDDVCAAATHGSLMGARGNSGVITSQIIRGACEGLVAAKEGDPTEALAQALERATQVAYQAVRKPVEGTILTVIKDMSVEARSAAKTGVAIEAALEAVSKAGHRSVANTPELLPVLKEAGVVDAGGYGLTIVFDGLVGALLGREVVAAPAPAAPLELAVAPVDDWDDNEFLYCTEFLLFGEGIDREAVHDQMVEYGGSELVVGDNGQYKIHVHTNTPSDVLGYALSLGQISDVHIHNMRMQQEARPGHDHSHDGDRGNGGATPTHQAPTAGESGVGHAAGERVKAAAPIGVVAVASGAGVSEILSSIGADIVVSGGQTMNPSTQDLVDAANRLDCESVIFLPNNKNIVLAANAAVTVLDKPAAVVATRSVLEGFAALLAFDGHGEVEQVAADMAEAIESVKTGEVTTAVKDAKSAVGDISEGQVIGIVGAKEIVAVGADYIEVALDLLATMVDAGSESLTVLVGEDMTDETADRFSLAVSERYPSLEQDFHRGDQPLYPIVLSVE